MRCDLEQSRIGLYSPCHSPTSGICGFQYICALALHRPHHEVQRKSEALTLTEVSLYALGQ